VMRKSLEPGTGGSHLSVTLATWEAEIGRIKVQGQDPISKITRTKWAEGVAQVVERLLCKCEALSLTLVTKCLSSSSVISRIQGDCRRE
jgi:hypothetical protein